MVSAADLMLHLGPGQRQWQQLAAHLPAARRLARINSLLHLSVQEDTEHAFEETYCAAFELLDRHWLALRATYMEFPIALR